MSSPQSSSIRTGLRWSVVEKVGVSVLGIVQLMIVVRYIPKAEIGLMAMSNTVLAFVSIFSEMGLSNSILYHQENRPAALTALFWVYAGVGGGLALLCFWAAPLAAAFFGAPELQSVFQWAALSLAISGLGQLPRALLYKHMEFRELSLAASVAAVASFATVVILAVMGWGVEALVAGLLSSTLAGTVLIIWMGRTLFSLSIKPDFSFLRSHLRFGAFQAAESLMTTFSTQFDTLIIGRLLGAEALGLYDIIKRLLERPMRLINPIVTRVLTPVLAEANADRGQMRRLYLQQLRYLSSTNFPIYVFLALAAGPVIELLLSSQYATAESLLLFPLFCVYFMIYTVQNPIGTLIIASGQVHRSFVYNFCIALVLPVLLWMAAQHSLVWVVAVMVGFQSIMIGVAQRALLYPAAGVTGRQLAAAILQPLLLAALAFALGSLAFWVVEPSWLALGLFAFFGGGLYVVLSWFWNRAYVLAVLKLVKG